MKIIYRLKRLEKRKYKRNIFIVIQSNLTSTFYLKFGVPLIQNFQTTPLINIIKL